MGVSKECWRCHRAYGEDSFYRNTTRADGLSDECKPCAREMARERYHRDIEASRERSRHVRSRRSEQAASPAILDTARAEWDENEFHLHLMTDAAHWTSIRVADTTAARALLSVVKELQSWVDEEDDRLLDGAPS